MHPYPPIAPGARVALVAPAGPLRMPADLDRAVDNVRAMGWEAVVGENASATQAYFAGADEARLADFNAAARDDSIAAIWCLRGGYGAMRLLDGIDYAAIRRHPKAIIGYSDITALHCAVATKCELGSIHGPTARSKLTAFSARSLGAAVSRDADPCGIAEDAETLVKGRAQGRLAGGNLALLCALHGTPFQPKYDGCILVVEDVNEAPYRVERMLLQLRLSGVLQRCAGIAFGSFTNTGETADKSLGGKRSMSEVLQEAAQLAGVPAVRGIPVGHIDDQWSIPFGADAELDADQKRLTVSLS
jgi:muramoyltetrapeptide carboxypeptidase